ncbi:acyl-CoA synthetase [Sulfitobacter sp. F26169L]|uniref:acyl-CoA synthetase n=1 Tax=Sulfitobacter sp. F26169L TaxID=2996015 RepID=UPI002260F5EA|nr:acyl-CoA synthetase [Sulfitobacter sp. F26169L]MCX7567916.1 acyl-CoA synthetase [Sulfitobacter sp. F26169L]
MTCATKHPSAFARTQPNKIAYRMASDGSQLSYAALNDRSNQGAQALRSLGVEQGDHIALLFENCLDLMVLAWAAQRSGVFYSAISTHLTVGEIAYIARDCSAKIMVISIAYAQHLPDLRAACPDILFFIAGGTNERTDNWQALADAMPALPIADEAAGADMLYSSGTTGQPKGIVRQFEPQPIETVIPALMTVLCETVGQMDSDTVYLSPAPLYHAAPLRFSMMTVQLGGTVIIMEKFDAEHLLHLIEARGVTHTQVVPTMFVRMLKLAQNVRGQFDVSSLKYVFHAAAPCPQHVKAEMIDWLGPILVEYYAGSEANGVTLALSDDWLRHCGTVGKSLLGNIVIVGEGGKALPAGEIGSVYFDSGIEFMYRGAPEKTAQAYLRPGCSTLGDVGYLNEDGYLFLTDRVSNMIVSGGVNIYPQETEDTLIAHPDVDDAAVFGVPNEEMGEEVKAVVQVRAGCVASPEKAAELIAFCRARLSGIKTPRSIDFHDALPRTPTGKLIKRKLKASYWPSEGPKV